MSEGTTEDRPKKRPWLAVLLAILYPGLGHLYLRKFIRAALWFLLIIGATSFLIPADAFPSTLSAQALVESAEAIPLQISLLILALSFLSVLDAYWMANQVNERARPTVDSDGEVQVENCPSCGKELDEDLDFCPWCSERLVEPETEDDEPTP